MRLHGDGALRFEAHSVRADSYEIERSPRRQPLGGLPLPLRLGNAASPRFLERPSGPSALAKSAADDRLALAKIRRWAPRRIDATLVRLFAPDSPLSGLGRRRSAAAPRRILEELNGEDDCKSDIDYCFQSRRPPQHATRSALLRLPTGGRQCPKVHARSCPPRLPPAVPSYAPHTWSSPTKSAATSAPSMEGALTSSPWCSSSPVRPPRPPSSPLRDSIASAALASSPAVAAHPVRVSAGDFFASGDHGGLPYLLEQRAGSGATLDGSGGSGGGGGYRGAWPRPTPFSPLRATQSSSAGAVRCLRRRADVARSDAPRAAGCRPCRRLRCARAAPPSLARPLLPAPRHGHSRARSPSFPPPWPALLRLQLPGTLLVPMPTPGAGAVSRRSEAARSGGTEARVQAADVAAREAPRGSSLACAQVLGCKISAASPGGAQGAVSDALRAEVRAPGLTRALSPPSTPRAPLLLLTFLRGSWAVFAAWAGRVRVVGGGRGRPGASAAAGSAIGATTGVGEARMGLGRPFFIKIITKTFHLWCEKCQKPGRRCSRPWRCRSSRCRHGRTSAPSAREPTRHRSRSSRRSLDEGGACWSIFARAALHLVGGVARPSAHSSSTACMPNASARSTLMLARPSEQSASKRTTCGSAAP